MKSSHSNTISFHGVIGNILTLGVRVPGSNPGGSTKLGSWKLIWMNQNYSNKNRNLAGVTVSFYPSQFFPRGKNGPAHSFPGEKTDRSVFSPGERFD